jgi:dynactin complex subunit
MFLGLQKHIDTMKYAPHVSQMSQRSSTPDLSAENEKLKGYLVQYENQIKDLETELKQFY